MFILLWPHNILVMFKGQTQFARYCYYQCCRSLVSDLCQAKSMWAELSSYWNTKRSSHQLFIYIWTLVFVEGASSTITEAEVFWPQIIWSKGSGNVSLFPASVSILILQGQPGGRIWSPCSLNPWFLSWNCQFWWAVFMTPSHPENWMNSIILNPREHL